MKIRIKINNKKYEAKEGETVLDVCRREGIKIPTLCAFEGLPREAVCRLCLVETNLTDKLVTSCTLKVCEKLEVTTVSERIEKARRINLELLWADHAGKCATCKKNRMCELQALAEEYPVKPYGNGAGKIENFHFVPRKNEMTTGEELALVKENWSRVVAENENPCVSRNSEFCVECRRCINICPEKKFGFNHRAGDAVVGTPYNQVLECSFCGECVRVCPVVALTDQNNFTKIIKDLDDLKKMAVAIVDTGMEEKVLEQLAKIGNKDNFRNLLEKLGFEKVIILSGKDLRDEVIKNFKADFARKEKINFKDIALFFISSEIKLKAKKGNGLDYVLSEREVARLARDKSQMQNANLKN